MANLGDLKDTKSNAHQVLILAHADKDANHGIDVNMRIAVVNLLMRTVRSRHFVPQLDRDLPTKGVRADSPMAVLLADEFAKVGHDVDIFVGSMFDVVRDAEKFQGKRASIVYVKEGLRWIFPPSAYPFAPSAISRLKKDHYDVILTTELVQPCTLAALAVRPNKARIFVWQELASHPRFPASSYSKFVFSLSRINRFRRMEKIIPRSESARCFLLSEGVPESKISQIIPNGVDCRTFTPEQPYDFFRKNGLGNPPRPRTIMVARIDSRKGIETFLEAAKIALANGHEGSFVLKVTGSGIAYVQNLAASLGVKDKVVIVGEYIPRKELANLMASCDICAAPSSGDLLFFVPLEAMACGLPVITTARTHHAATFSDGRAGLLIPHNDSKALAEAIVGLNRDRQKLRQMAAAARDLAVREFSIESVARRFVGEFERECA